MKKIISHPLFTGSLIMVIGSNLVNVLNYLYHLIMGRLLGPAGYGELASVLSLMGLLGMLPFSLGLVITKFISSAKTPEESNQLISWLDRRTTIASLIIFASVALLSPLIDQFLNLGKIYLVVIVGALFIFSMPSFFYKSALQGLLKFKENVLSTLGEYTTKLVVGAILVLVGWSVLGAAIGLLLAAFVGWFIARSFLKIKTEVDNSISVNLPAMVKYSIPVIFQSIAQTSLFSTDLILVKHFFSAHDAGIYAAVSTLGKIIYFGAGPIGSVMFPLVSKRKIEGQNFKQVFLLSLLLTVVLSLSITAVYLFLPDFSINLLYGSSYLEARGLLFSMGIFMSLFTLSSLVISYFLSVNRTRIIILPVVAAIAQIIGIYLVHDSLLSVVSVSILVTALLLTGLFVYLCLIEYVNFSHSTSLQKRKNHQK